MRRVLRWPLRLLPAHYRSTRSDEIEDALGDTSPTARSALAEWVGLLGAVFSIWRKHLLTPQGIKNSLFFGTAAWFGFLVALGPIDRVQAFEQGRLSDFVLDPTTARAAIGLSCCAYAALFWRRSAAFLLGSVGLVLAALSIRVGGWQLVSSLPYELRWLGVPLLASIAFRGRRSLHWSTALLGALPAAGLLLVSQGATTRGTGYGFTLARMFEHDGPTTTVLVGLQWMDIIVLGVGVVCICGPWLFPAGIAVALPAMVHVTAMAPGLGEIALVAYLSIAVWARTYLARGWPRSWSELVRLVQR